MTSLKAAWKYFIAAVLIVFVIFTTHHFSKPDWNCDVTSEQSIWSGDKQLKATLVRKSCNLGETVFYSVRIDSVTNNLSNGWFIPGLELENDSLGPWQPTLNWITDKKIEIDVPTESITGKIEQHWNGGLIVVRNYVPSKIGADSKSTQNK